MKKLILKFKIWYWKRFDYEQYLMYEFRKRFQKSKETLIFNNILYWSENTPTYKVTTPLNCDKPNTDQANA